MPGTPALTSGSAADTVQTQSTVNWQLYWQFITKLTHKKYQIIQGKTGSHMHKNESMCQMMTSKK